jgi:hypothetical protein
MRRSNVEHRRIYEAIAKGNAAKAKQYAEEHIQAGGSGCWRWPTRSRRSVIPRPHFRHPPAKAGDPEHARSA